ncbi:MAG: helix-turn-helix transcriptional regulator [Propionibacteriaceae bacterium]|nr:helix-turn-helix transcriptional regulator [Propionibacteriaceae bacterium]
MGAMSEGTPTRFRDLLYGIEGISQKMLTKNLRALEHDGIISRLVGERGEEPRLVGRVGFVGQLLGAQSGTDRREQAEGFVGVGVSRQLALPRGGGQVCPGLLDEVLGEGVGARAWLGAGNGSPEQQRCQATPQVVPVCACPPKLARCTPSCRPGRRPATTVRCGVGGRCGGGDAGVRRDSGPRGAGRSPRWRIVGGPAARGRV